MGPLALPGVASYPVSVRRPAASLHASFPRSVALAQLRFASLVVVNSWENFHLQDCAHAGRTKRKGGPGLTGAAFFLSSLAALPNFLSS